MMRLGTVLMLAFCLLALMPREAHACATCNVDGGVGQGLMLFFLLTVPLLALGFGVRVVRRLLRQMETR